MRLVFKASPKQKGYPDKKKKGLVWKERLKRVIETALLPV